MDIRADKNWQAVEIKAAQGFEAHQIERDGSIIGYTSRTIGTDEWTVVLPDGTELAQKETSLDAASNTLYKVDNQLVYNQYDDEMKAPS